MSLTWTTVDEDRIIEEPGFDPRALAIIARLDQSLRELNDDYDKVAAELVSAERAVILEYKRDSDS